MKTFPSPQTSNLPNHYFPMAFQPHCVLLEKEHLTKNIEDV